MKRLNPWVAGSALAIAFEVMYIGCALAFALWPDASMKFFNAWFQGIDLTLLRTGKSFSPALFLYGFMGGLASTFVFGVIFGFAYNGLIALAGRRADKGTGDRDRQAD